MVDRPAFSVVVPCFNEEANIETLVKRCAWAAEVGEGEFVIVDNGSTDGTGQILAAIADKSQHIRVVSVEQNRGYGFGIMAGLNVSSAPIVGWTHADQQTDPADVLRGILLFGDGEEKLFVKGLRYARPAIDRAFSLGMALLLSTLFLRRFRDVNAQPTLFSRELLAVADTPPGGFALDTYFYVAALRSAFAVRRIPVLFLNRRFGRSSWNFGLKTRLKASLASLRYAVSLRFGQG